MLSRQPTDPPTPSSSSSSCPKQVSPISNSSSTGGGGGTNASTTQYPWLPAPATAGGAAVNTAATRRPSAATASLMQPPPIPPPPHTATASSATQTPAGQQPGASASSSAAEPANPGSSRSAAASSSLSSGGLAQIPADGDLAGFAGQSRPLPPGGGSRSPVQPRAGGDALPPASEVAPPATRRAPAQPNGFGRPRDSFVIDLTSSSPPSGRRILVPAARASGLALPGSSSTSRTASTSTSTSQSRPRRRPQPAESSAAARELLLSSGDETDDSDYIPLAGPSRSGGPAATAAASSSSTTGVAAGVRARRRRRDAMGLSSDSDIEVVSERPASHAPPAAGPSRLSRYGLPIGSPPPFIVPPGATATSASTTGRSQPRRSTRARTGPGAPGGGAAARAGPSRAGDADEDADAIYARALADAEAAELGYDDYETAQRSAAGTAGGGRRGGGAGSSGRGGRGFGGVFRHAGPPRGEGFFSDYLTGLFMDNALGPHSYFNTFLGGGFWGGGAAVHGGAGSLTAAYGGGGGPGAGGWGGAAKVKAASKKYGVRMSHPAPNERGFSRDIIEPRDPGALQPPPPPTAAAAKKGRSKAAAAKSTEECEPVCASCLERLLLSGTGDHKVFALRCGHAVCAKCLDEAKARCRAIREQEKGGWVTSSSSSRASQANGTLALQTLKRKGGVGPGHVSSNSPEVYLSSGSDDESDDDPSTGANSASLRPTKRRRQNGASATAPPPPPENAGRGNKGKGKSRADETGVEEDWTTCPVSTCDGRGTDLLATQGWSRPFEFFT
ncbi:hypothetical protein JCM3774_004173 [Rhodotorula dairenensis]